MNITLAFPWILWWTIFPFLFVIVSKRPGKEWIRGYAGGALLLSLAMLGFVYELFWWHIVYCVVIALLWCAVFHVR
jgi:hypothetical protein